MAKDILIQTPSKSVGKLVFAECLPVDGTHPKADCFYVLYSLIVNNSPIQGTFSNRFAVNDEALFVTELFIQRTPESTGVFEGSYLKQINLKMGDVRTISEFKNGYVYPKCIEQNKIIYTKELFGFSTIHEFEPLLSRYKSNKYNWLRISLFEKLLKSA